MQSAKALETEWWDTHRALCAALAWASSGLFVLYGVVDYLMVPDLVTFTWPWRLLGAASCAAYAVATRWSGFNRWAPWMGGVVESVSTTVVSIVFLGILKDIHMLMVAQLQVAMCLVIVAPVRTGIRMTIPVMMLSVNVGLHAMDAVWTDIVLVNSTVGGAAVLLLVVSEVSFRAFRRSLELEARLRHDAGVDPLSGLSNRRAFMEEARRIWSACARNGRAMVTVIVDIDHFKSVNDRCGHEAGDDVIRTLAAVMTAQLRQYDLACRYGGEEFAFLLPETQLDDALAVAERLRQAVADTEVRTLRQTVRCTVSVGLACHGAQNASLEQALREADAALYQAKESGRNRVCGAPQSERLTPSRPAPDAQR